MERHSVPYEPISLEEACNGSEGGASATATDGRWNPALIAGACIAALMLVVVSIASLLMQM